MHLTKVQLDISILSGFPIKWVLKIEISITNERFDTLLAIKKMNILLNPNSKEHTLNFLGNGLLLFGSFDSFFHCFQGYLDVLRGMSLGYKTALKLGWGNENSIGK